MYTLTLQDNKKYNFYSDDINGKKIQEQIDKLLVASKLLKHKIKINIDQSLSKKRWNNRYINY